jgi:vanillate O-demethylase monooxygenase subunit
MTSPVTFLRNTWYVAATSNEVNDSDFLSRMILGEPVLIYRQQSGVPVAMRDRCPHRFAPLSRGKRQGDSVSCIYHGLSFNAEGQCTHNPHGDGRISERAKVQVFPLVEQAGFIWIWMGAAEQADPSQIVDCSKLLSAKPTAVATTYIHSQSNYQLIADNLMDLTHIDHLHGPLINTHGHLSPQTAEVVELGGSVKSSWQWSGDTIELMRHHLADPEGEVRNTLDVAWHPPAIFMLDLFVYQGEVCVSVEDYHLLTPETATTTHYFFASTRNYNLDDAEYNAQHIAGMRHAFATEDMPVIEAQQLAMGDEELFDLKPLVLPCDTGGVRVRRKLSKMIEAEQTQPLAMVDNR